MRAASTPLAAIDISLAFDTIDYQRLIARFRVFFNIDGSVLQWLTSFLSDRSFFFSISNSSLMKGVKYGVPQFSVLCPLVFSLFISPIAFIVSHYGFLYQHCADDTQLLILMSPATCVVNCKKLENCLIDLNLRFGYSCPSLNADETELIFSAQHNV
jgi:hypothetical protein